MTEACKIVKANALHASLMFCAGIRQADIDEWVGGTGKSVLIAMLDALPSSNPEVFLLNGKPLAMWGVQPISMERLPGTNLGVGQVWFLATTEAERHVLSLHRVFGEVLHGMHRRYPSLIAYTHPSNTLHHKWMERHGFVYSHNFPSIMGVTYLAYTHHEEAT